MAPTAAKEIPVGLCSSGTKQEKKKAQRIKRPSLLAWSAEEKAARASIRPEYTRGSTRSWNGSLSMSKTETAVKLADSRLTRCRCGIH